MTAGTSGSMGSPVATIHMGGQYATTVLDMVAQAYNDNAAGDSYLASLAGALAGYENRASDWAYQLSHTLQEAEQIKKQLAAAQVRTQVAQYELENHQKQIDNAKDTLDYLRSRKYTNEELYSWLLGQISRLFFQSYQMAYDWAKKAERCYRFERGITNSNIIQFGYWDSVRKGLMAGEQLYLGLKRLEQAYLEGNRREYEITKQVSLLQIDPLALIRLRQTGRCEFSLPESLFDLDYPGHYFRRIKSVSLSVPCVVGPYTGLNATLTLLSNRIRTSSLATAYPEKSDEDDARFLRDFAASGSIAASQALNDSGMFELNFRDERYLPFEGAGATRVGALNCRPSSCASSTTIVFLMCLSPCATRRVRAGVPSRRRRPGPHLQPWRVAGPWSVCSACTTSS